MKKLLTVDRGLRMSFWLHLVTSVICAAILASAILISLDDREAALYQAETRADAMAGFLAQHASDTFELTELALTSVSRLIGSGALTQSEIEDIKGDMKALLGQVPRLRKLAYYEQSGWLITSSDETSKDLETNISRQPMFLAHRKDGGGELAIGHPYQTDPSGSWRLDLSQAVLDSDGHFGGVLVATMNIAYFSNFYRQFERGEGTRVTLLGGDGHLIVRNPYGGDFAGRDFTKSELFLRVQAGAEAGHVRIVSPIDGVERLSSFRHVPGTPLTVIYSIPKGVALAPWRQSVVPRAAFVCMVLGGVLFAHNRFGRYARERLASEEALREMSRTDKLTGLLNRRAFDYTLATEWLRCVASGEPLSLLMIDIDSFKAFNDAYGHQAGDACLQSVAGALRDAVHGSSDRVTRYGGEEFAIVLPNTDPTDARLVAERARIAVEALGIASLGAAAGIVTISVGYATEDRRERMRASEIQLTANADRALYAAKMAGRNRSACGDAATPALRDSREPRLVHGA